MRVFWLSSALLVILHYCFYFEKYTASFLVNFLNNNESVIFIYYIVISLVRSFFFLPSTIFVVMGAVLFPNHLHLVFLISIIGILFGSVLIYYSANILKIEDLLPKRISCKLNVVVEKIRDYGFWIVLGWSFFPVVPTDLICYVAGYSKMNFFKFIIAVLIGELILVGVYLFISTHVFNFLF